MFVWLVLELFTGFDGWWQHLLSMTSTSASSLCLLALQAMHVVQVDIDLNQEGDARKVSRQQAHLSLRPDGHFQFTNIGRRTVSVNGVQVTQHCSVSLEHLSFIDLAGVHLLFIVNHLAVHRLVARSQNLVL